MGFHFIQAVTIMIIMPIVCSLIDIQRKEGSKKWIIITKWFLFWSIGIRSFTAGTVQLIYPKYTAEIIFDLVGNHCYIFIRELGVANIAIGLSAIISFKYADWRIPIAFISLIFYLFLSLNHIVNFQAGFNEIVSLAGDMLVVLVLCVFLVKSNQKLPGI